jgi:hypothetical protein
MPSCMRQPCSGFLGRANRSSTPMWMAPAGFWYRPRMRGRGFSFTSVRQASSWMMPVRPSAMPMSAHRHLRTTSRLTWQARHGLNRSYWRPTSRASAPSLFASRRSGGPATRSAGRCPRQSTPGSSPSSTVVTMPLTPATSTMSSKLFNAPWSVVRVVAPCSSPIKRN